MQNVQFLYIDQYEEVTLHYLANCLKLIQVQTINLLYHDQNSLGLLESIFHQSDFPNLTLQLQDNDNIDALWDVDEVDVNGYEEKVQQIVFIENPKINSGWSAVQQNYFVNAVYIKMTENFINLIPKEQQPSIRQSKGTPVVNNLQKQEQMILQTPEQIVEEAQAKIDSITQRALFEEWIGRFSFLLTLYDYYNSLKGLNECQATLQSISSIVDGSLQIVTLVYLGMSSNMYVTALIVLTIVHPILQLISFAVFQAKMYKEIPYSKQAVYVLVYGIFNFLKIWEIIMILMYLTVKKFAEMVRREFNAEAYIKFKNYASKFEGSLPLSVFSYQVAQVDPKSIQQIKSQPFYQAVIWVTDVQEALNKLPSCFIYILAISDNKYMSIMVFALVQQVKESYASIKELLEVFIQDFLIPAQILSKVSVELFLQSLLYFNSIKHQMKLDYPKSFSILSKANQRFIKEKCTLKINLKTLDFTDYQDLKREKMLAQVRLVLASIENFIEIDETQRVFCMGSEIDDFIRCLRVSPIYQLKLNFNLDEVDPNHIRYFNAFIKYCPPRLQFLQLSIDASEQKSMEFFVGRQDTLRAFSYSYFQIIKIQKSFNPLQRQKKNSKLILNINQDFLHLDRYNFEQFYFEVSGNLALAQCHELLTKFTEMKVFKLSFYNKADVQTFEFSKNIISRVEILDITFENIILDFEKFQFNNLTILKMVLRKKCLFEKDKLLRILSNLNSKNTKEVYIDLSQCDQRFTTLEQTEVLRNLERKKIDVVIKI